MEGALPYQRVGLPTNLGGCADPTLAVDSKGTLYSLFNGGSVIPGVGTTSPEFPSFCCSFTVSHDGGRSWSEPKLIETTEEAAQHTLASGSLDIAFDRPWLIIDPVTGTLYGSSSDDSLVQRVVFASHDHGVTWTTPQPLDPDFQSVWGDVPSAAFGVLGAAYSVDPTSGFYKASLDPAVKCHQACAVFETSTNDGKTWTRHVIPTGQVLSGLGSQPPTAPGLQVAADPSARDHFAVLVPVTASEAQIWVTTDAGWTWKRTRTITAPGSGTIANAWIAYGRTGAAAVVWRNLHGAGSYDVFASVSTNGGRTFGAPVKLTRTPAPAPRQPAGRPGDDCACNLYLDGKYLYTTWGDSRSGNLQVWLARYRY